jgi:hypothetical protein
MFIRIRLLLLIVIGGALVSVGGALAQSGTSTGEDDSRLADLQSEISYRIIGGKPANEGAWPWQVVLYMRGAGGQYNMHCGGSVIDPNWVLTAAHCITSRNAAEYFIVEGTNRIDRTLKKSGGQGRTIAIRQVSPHEGFNSTSLENDIALLRLATPAKSTPVSLALQENNPLELPGHMSTVTGWGLLRAFDDKWKDFSTQETVRPGDPRYFTDRLMEVDVPLVSEAICQQVFKAKIDHRVLCAGFSEGGKDSCRGDSGGPLVGKDPGGRFLQIGVVSFGALNCAAKGVYGAYTKVSAFENWLRVTSGLKFPPSPTPPDVIAQPPTTPGPPALPPAPTPVGNNRAEVAVSFVQGETLKVGQTVQVKVTTGKPGYLLLLDMTPGRKATLIFPNERSLSTPTGGRAKSNYIEPSRPLLVPDPKNPYEGFEFIIEPPLGAGALVAILSADPLQSISSLPALPKTMDQTEALEYFANLTEELSRNLEVSGTARTRDWSYAVKGYQIVQ